MNESYSKFGITFEFIWIKYSYESHSHSSCDKNTDLLHAKIAKMYTGETTVLGRHFFFVWVGFFVHRC